MTHENKMRRDQECRAQLISEFLQGASGKLEVLRGQLPHILTGDLACWHALENFAKDALRSSAALGLGVLESCTRELDFLVEERLRSAIFSYRFQLLISTSLEVIAIEVRRLQSTHPT